MKNNRKITVNLFILISVLFGCLALSGCEEAVKQVYNVELVEQSEDAEQEESTEEAEEAVEEETEPDILDREAPLPEPLALEEETEEPQEEEEPVDDRPVVDLIMFMGQSNMSGAGGDASKAISLPEGWGYEFRAISDPTRLYNIEEPFGKNESFIGGICDLPGAKKGSIVSAFAYEYYKETGVPIVGVSASQGASTTEIWLYPGFQYDLKERYDRAVVWLEGNGYKIRYRFAVWFQGESDAANNVTADVYSTNLDNIMRPLFIGGLNRVFIVTPGRTLSIRNYFDTIVNQQLNICRDSGYYALGTNLLSGVSTAYMVDEWHYNQDALNLVGYETAKSVAYLVNNGKERVDYDYKNGQVFIPDGNDYTGEESAEPYDLSNIGSLVEKLYSEDTQNTEDSNNTEDEQTE